MENGTDLLAKIYARRREDLAAARARIPLRELKARVEDAGLPRGFARALRIRDRIAVIAEIKFRSPSEGILNWTNSTSAVASEYEASGADALSVLTEPHHFGGDLSDLQTVKDAVALPVLRKDFIFDPYQIYESRTAGADAVLLIVAMLERRQIGELIDLSQELQMDVLLEIHSEQDLDKAGDAEPATWGVNHRDLRTLKINLDVSEKLMPLLPAQAVKVAESGLGTADQLLLMRKRGADAALIGSSLMRSPKPGVALKNLLTATCG